MKIKCLLVMPGVKVQVIKIPANYKFIKNLIGEHLNLIKLDENTVIIHNRKPKNDEFNRIYGEKVIKGSFLILGIKNGYRKSLNKRQIRRYSNMFKLRKHEKKIKLLREEYLMQYYGKLQNNYLKEANYQNAA